MVKDTPKAKVLRPVLLFPIERTVVRLPKKQQHFVVVLQFRNSITRSVDVKASTREIAEHRALKRHPEASGVVRG